MNRFDIVISKKENTYTLKLNNAEVIENGTSMVFRSEDETFLFGYGIIYTLLGE